jgi:two-component system response regulator RegA
MLVDSLKKSLLLLDDDEAYRKTLALEFGERGYTVFTAAGLDEVRAALAAGAHFDFAILDLRLRAELGLNILDDLLRANQACRAVMLTGYPTTATTVLAMRKGAVNCLLKPASVTLLEQALWIEGVGEDFDFGAGEGEAIEAPSLAQYERELMEFVLAQCDWNVTRAAKRLGLHRQSLQRKLRKYPAFAGRLREGEER